MLTGSLLGWIAYSYLNFNEERGVMVSLVVGALGGLMAAAFLGNLVYKRWGI